MPRTMMCRLLRTVPNASYHEHLALSFLLATFVGSWSDVYLGSNRHDVVLSFRMHRTTSHALDTVRLLGDFRTPCNDN